MQVCIWGSGDCCEATWPENCVQVWAVGTVVRLPGQKTVCAGVHMGQWGLL